MEANKNLEKEYQFYLDNIGQILENHKNKFIVIKGQQIIGEYDSIEAALSSTIKEHKPGTFLIQHCISNVEEQTFYSRVIFN